MIISFVKLRILKVFTYALSLCAIMSGCKPSVGTALHCKNDHCTEPFKNMARYDNYRIYSVEFSNNKQVELFKQLEKECDTLQFIGHPREVGQKLSVLVAANKVADIEDLLEYYQVKHRILTRNFQEKIDRCLSSVLPIGTELTRFDWQHFFHLETIYEWLASLVKQYPDIVSLLDMGNSSQGVPIKGIKLAHNNTNKTIFIEAGIHAREWIAPAAATYIINILLTSQDDKVKKLATSYNWLIFPCINPDGYKYTFDSDRMWRKNRQLFYSCRGVDLNRNYPDHWNFTGSSDNPCHYDYAGPSAGSELETQRVMAFIESHVKKEQIKTYIALHSYSQMIMFPFGYTNEKVHNYDDLKELGESAAAAIKGLYGRTYVSGSLHDTIYPSSGGSMDWAYAVQGIPIAYTFELRGPPDSQDMFILPAEEILPTAQEAFVAVQAIVEGADKKGYFN